MKVCILTEVRMNPWEILEYVGETLVFFGVAGEVYAEWESKERERLGKASSIVLIIGLALSLAALIATNESFNQTIAALNFKASNAIERASADEKNAAQLRKDAESERLARVELEESIEWRRIPLDQRPSIAARLKSFKDERAWLSYNMNDVESNDFGVDIAETLKLAHWKPTEPESILKMFEGPVNLGTNNLPRGVVVKSTPDPRSVDAAAALVRELVMAGFDASIAPSVPLGTSPTQAKGVDAIMPGSNASTTPTVFVSIEPRPDGPQGKANLRAAAKKITTRKRLNSSASSYLTSGDTYR